MKIPNVFRWYCKKNEGKFKNKYETCINMHLVVPFGKINWYLYYLKKKTGPML